MTSRPEPTPIQIAPDWQKKGEMLMSGLVEEIGGLWLAMSRVKGEPVPGGHLEIENLNGVLNWLRRALTTIRSLDGEVFTRSNRATYEAVREAHPFGVAVRGLIGPRNNAVHHPEVVDPDVARAVGPLDDGLYVIFPRWRVRDSELDPMFSFNGKFRQAYADAYDEGLAGRPLLDPLLDAFSFFDLLAPSLAKRDADGALVGFPLAPSPVAPDYRRLHPSWPSEVEQDALVRGQLAAATPTGRERHIVAALEVDGETVLAGWTQVDATHRLKFVEPAGQVRRDIGRGYPYFVSGEGTPVLVGPEAAMSLNDEDGLLRKQLGAGPEEREVWLGTWRLCRVDASYYRSLRLPPVTPTPPVAPSVDADALNAGGGEGSQARRHRLLIGVKSRLLRLRRKRRTRAS